MNHVAVWLPTRLPLSEIAEWNRQVEEKKAAKKHGKVVK
jgi:hypothetical protein